MSISRKSGNSATSLAKPRELSAQTIDVGKSGLKVYRDKHIVWIELTADETLIARETLPLFDSVAKAAVAEQLIRAVLIALTAGMSAPQVTEVLDSAIKALQSMGAWVDTQEIIIPRTFKELSRGAYNYSFVDKSVCSLITGEYGCYAEAQEIDPRDIGVTGPGEPT